MNDFPVQTSQQLADHLRSLRRRLKLTQAQLGVRLGVEQARIGKIERNPGSISVDQLLKLLVALNASLRLDPLDSSSRVPRTKTKVEW